VSEFPFVSRLVALAPLDARAAFDAAADGQWPCTGARLVLGRPDRVVARPHYAPCRRVRGTLFPDAGRRGLPVVVEVLPWSDDRVELGITVVERPRQFGRRLARAYLGAAPGLLDCLADGLERVRPLVPPRLRIPAPRVGR
jgi:hypothetical protein